MQVSYQEATVGSGEKYRYDANIMTSLTQEAIYLGPTERTPEEIKRFADQEVQEKRFFQFNKYNLFFHNCRSFVHSVCVFLDLEPHYLALSKHFRHFFTSARNEVLQTTQTFKHAILGTSPNERSLLIGIA
jgi:hypothetical protein